MAWNRKRHRIDELEERIAELEALAVDGFADFDELRDMMMMAASMVCMDQDRWAERRRPLVTPDR